MGRQQKSDAFVIEDLLHLGRASEAGVMAASLAKGGFEAPRTVIEGEFGFLRVFCTAWDESHLTKGLGSEDRKSVV